MNITAELHNWHYNIEHKTILGHVFKDSGNKNRTVSTGRFSDGDFIQTSTVQEFLEDGLYARTLNSIYKLDPPFKEKNGTVPS